MKYFISAIFIFFIVTSINLSAQSDRTGKIGIGYSGNLSARSNEIGVTFFATNVFSIEPQLGFQSISVDDNSATTYKLGIGFMTRVKDFVVTPYVGARIKYNMVSGDDETYGDLIITGAFGGEYFVSEWFSISAEMRLNYIKTDKDFSPTYSIADANIFETEQVLNLRIYFN